MIYRLCFPTLLLGCLLVGLPPLNAATGGESPVYKKTGKLDLEYSPHSGKGYILKADEANSLALGMYAQLHFSMTDYDDGDGNPNNNPESDTSMYIHNAKIYAKGNFWKKDFTYKVQVKYDGSSTGGSFVLDDAYGNAKLYDEQLELRAGQFKVPFLREAMMDSTRIFFARRSLLASENKSLTERDTGVMLHGLLPIEDERWMGYALDLMEGRGANNGQPGSKGTFSGLSLSNDSVRETRFLYAGRIYFYLGPYMRACIPEDANLYKSKELEMEFGVNMLLLQGSDGDVSNGRIPDGAPGDGVDPEVNAYSLDFTLRGYNGLLISAEYLMKTTDEGVAGASDIDAAGWRAQASFMFDDTFGALGAEYVRWDPNTDDTAGNNDMSQITLGWNKYIGNMGNSHRVSLNYVQTKKNIVGQGEEITNEWLVAWQISL